MAAPVSSKPMRYSSDQILDELRAPGQDGRWHEFLRVLQAPFRAQMGKGGAVSADSGRHHVHAGEYLPRLLWIPEDNLAVFTVAGSVQQIIADHQGTGAGLGGVLANGLQRSQASHKLSGFDPRDDADLPATTKPQPRAIRVEVVVKFLEIKRIHLDLGRLLAFLLG